MKSPKKKPLRLVVPKRDRDGRFQPNTITEPEAPVPVDLGTLGLSPCDLYTLLRVYKFMIAAMSVGVTPSTAFNGAVRLICDARCDRPASRR